MGAANLAEETTILKSVCRSCHGGCGVLMYVKDGVLTDVKGDPDSPLNKGRLCPIGASTKDIVYHPDRLKYPMRRIGERRSGKWERITWDEALDEIANKITKIKNEFGPESIVMGTGTGRHQIAGCLGSVMPWEHRIGASPVLHNASTRESMRAC